ncbi:MAG TPA: PEP-CTERM sorting domain-containing protein [Lacipirellulaceae bacterium]
MFSKPGRITLLRISAMASLLLVLTVTTARAGFVTFSVGGTSATSSIQSKVDSFRAALGGPNNGNNPGPLASGRREINWDGGGATTATVSGSVLSAFTNTRGSTFTTEGERAGFLQTPLTDPALTIINPNYATTFSAFSPQRIFTPTGSNITDVTFFVPGSNGAIPATVGGFGAVFSDVDLPNVTRLEFFDASKVQIFSVNVLPGMTTDGSLSFLGAVGDAGEQIARVRITTGNSALGPNDDGNLTDVVVMDDFFYSEPTAVPEPTSTVLVGFAALSVAGLGKLRRRSANRAWKEQLQPPATTSL